MAITLPPKVLAYEYDRFAREYSLSLTPEDRMESPEIGTQRAITLACLGLVSDEEPDVQVFNELLILYPLPGQRKPGLVVPDNTVFRWHEPLQFTGASFNVPLQPVKPLLVLEYTSKSSETKDYEDNLAKYEKDLKIPYYLIFYPDAQELTLYKLKGRKYGAVKPNHQGRCAIPELNLEVQILAGWLRYWYKGELLPMPATIRRELKKTKQELGETKQELAAATRRNEELAQELERLRAQLLTQSRRKNGS